MKLTEIVISDPDTEETLYRHKFPVWENLEEMQPEQFINWANLIHAGYPEEELKVRALTSLSQVNFISLASKFPSISFLDIMQPYIDLFDPIIEQKAISKCFFSDSKFGLLAGYKAMGDLMENIVFCQYGMADHNFMLYLKEGKDDHLDELCGTLFVPKKHRYNPEDAILTIAYFRQVPKAFKIGIMHNYWLLRNFQKQLWPLAFSSGESYEAAEENKSIELTDWNAISIGVAETQVFGYKEKVDYSPINDILKFLHDRKKNEKTSK